MRLDPYHALMPELPPEALEDYFRPPLEPTDVVCIDCGEVYLSDTIKWRGGFWRCPTPGCSGAGFGFVIMTLDPDYLDPEGRSLPRSVCWSDDDDDEDAGDSINDDDDGVLYGDDDDEERWPGLADLLREREARQCGL